MSIRVGEAQERVRALGGVPEQRQEGAKAPSQVACQVRLTGEPSDPRALLGYGDVARRNKEGNPAPEAGKRVPFVLKMLVAGGKAKAGQIPPLLAKLFL